MDPVDQIVDLALADPDFRKQLLANPVEALRARGITLDAEQIALLQSIASENIGVVSDELSQRLAKVSEVERSY
jgi:hypothetical protein